MHLNLKNFIIRQDLLETVVQYLLTRPMGEVEGLVAALRHCRPKDDTPVGGTEEIVIENERADK